MTGSIPRLAGRKTRLESRIEESHLLRQNIALFCPGNTGTGALIKGGAKETPMFLQHLRALAMTQMWW